MKYLVLTKLVNFLSKRKAVYQKILLRYFILEEVIRLFSFLLQQLALSHQRFVLNR